MKFDEAAEASPHKKSILYRQGEGPNTRCEVYDGYSKSFFQIVFAENNTFTVDRKPGRGTRNSDDWVPMTKEPIHERVEAWKAENEDRPLIPEQKWEDACMASPLNKCFRFKKGDGLMMIRDGRGFTFSEELGGAIVQPVGGPFRAFDGWEPMPEDHYYAAFDFLATGVVRYPEGGRLGKAYTSPKKTKKQKGVINPSAPPVTIDPRVYQSIDVMVQSLASIATSTETGAIDRNKAVDELLRLSKTLGWHLREDRGKYQTPKGET